MKLNIVVDTIICPISSYQSAVKSGYTPSNVFFTKLNLDSRVETEAKTYSSPVLKKDITKTLFRMKRASLETEAQRIIFARAIMTSLVTKFASVIINPKDLTAK